MKISTDGLILTEQTIGENDKLITVLTRSNGIIRCFVKGAKLIKGRKCTATQSLSYSRLSIYFGREKYIIDEAEPIELFFNLRNDIEKLSLAQYFCELAMYIIPENSAADEYLSLILNSLYILSNKKRSPLMIKAVYEMRILSLAGYMPDLVCCDECKCYESDTMYFIFDSGKILCQNCFKGNINAMALSRGAITALRYSIYAEPKKIFSFSISDVSLMQFADCAETFLLKTIDHHFNSLDFYKQVRTQ
ncbi:MAG: DNA repair protein RecO [Clostridia bacterium]|nr:DNA repair protein RecO [Clostridia bacterium]